MKTLYLRILSTVVFLMLFVQSNYAQSDLCSGIVPVLTIGSTCAATNYIVPASFGSLTPAPTCQTTSRDGWFTFATNATQTNISIIASGSTLSTQRIGLALYTGSCGSFTQTNCIAPGTGNATLAGITVSPNTTYLLRIFRANNNTADLSGTICIVNNPQFNDACTLSTSLPINNTLTCTNSINATSVGATQSLPGCAGTADDDVWFSLVPTSSTHYITVTNGSMYDSVLEMFSGNCGTLTSIGCVDGTTGNEVALATGLTIGATYYIRVYSFGNTTGQGTFNICITTPENPAPYCAAAGTNSTYYINNFTTSGAITNISNATNFSPGGYGNYTAQSLVALAGSTINFNAQFPGTGIYGFNIWVDWNNNNTFDTTEKVYGSGAYVNPATGSFTIPGATAAGNYRMRIRGHWLSTDPSACGTIDYGETEDYTLRVQALTCSTTPTSLNATNIASTSANFSWAATSPAPAAGYNYYYSTTTTPPPFNSTGSGNISSGTTVPLTGLTPSTTYYAWVRSNCGGANNLGYWAGPISFTTGILTTGVAICQGGTGILTANSSCTGQTSTTTITGSWNTLPIANQIEILMGNSTVCNFDNNTATYSSINFQVSVSGTYIFSMASNTNYDGMAYIVSGAFTPGSCATGTWIVGDDDSGTGLEPRLTTPLVAGTTYTLISTVFSFSNITIVDNYQYSVSGPGSVLLGTPGTIQWYTTPIGGSPIATGATFNPVGVTGSGLTNTNTPGTTTYYAACSLSPTVRTPTTFTINSGPTSIITTSGSVCNNDATINITLTGTPPWNLTYANTLGNPPVTLTGITSNTLTISVTPASSTTYTVTAMNDATCASVSNSGSAYVSANTWLGTTPLWSAATNWSDGVVPTASDCVIIPPAANPATITNSTIGYANIVAVKAGGELEITNQRSLVISNNLNVAPTATFDIDDSASLIQINSAVNSGSISMKRITKPMYRYDFSYWNSPVALVSDFTLSELSPLTLSDKYFRWQPSISNGAGNWISLPPLTTNMDPRNGYIVRAPQTFSTIPTVKTPFTAFFRGTPNNGNIVIPISTGTLGAAVQSDKWNLIGNPYPSAVDALQFLNTNNTVLDGTIYLWTHNSAPSASNPNPFYGNFVYNYSMNDYATYNSFGGVAAVSGGSIPTQYIASGTAFFVAGKVTAGSAVFTNAMRVINNNDNFYKPSDIGTLTLNNTESTSEKHRIWLNFMNENDLFSQILVGYTDGATFGYDNGLDGNRLASAPTSFYSVIDEHNLAIQARPAPFDASDRIPLGYVTQTTEQFSIQLQQIDPLFEGYDILLEDKTLNIIHNLKSTPYHFTSTVGRFNDRFELKFMNNLLGVAGLDYKVASAFIKAQTLYATSNQTIDNIVIYDLAGRKVITLNSANSISENAWRFPYAEGVYLSIVTLTDGTSSVIKLNN